jgi:uncharacterized BrkB/YihY/UPF0761 family membrane protein
MSRRGKIMVGGAIFMVIGIIIGIFGYSKFQSIAGTLAAVAEETPAGVVEATIGILIMAIGMFIAIYGFGQMEENKRLKEIK